MLRRINKGLVTQEVQERDDPKSSSPSLYPLGTHLRSHGRRGPPRAGGQRRQLRVFWKQ